uniref:Putative conserved secreted protein n=1 Tax=Amblyomma tuberculatum TaxID=48802 RepID=A0A6M2E4T7_9ACAR
MKKRRCVAWFWLLTLAIIGAATVHAEEKGGTKTAEVKGESTKRAAKSPKHSTEYMQKRWKCMRLGKTSTDEAPNRRCWFYCFNEQQYRILRLPEPNGTPCWADKNYPKGECKYSRCRQPHKKKGWSFRKWIFSSPYDVSE